ncbi:MULTISPECIES: hypothetical protein [unclassified Pseudomonas]|jgi:hypothetical protein|uniref:hypothetical protein n=1 Tax=unclassified Pseudomonas TaxID=196821 RepID=UPI000288CF24|nr:MULTISPECIES: hypothetical protein [unclassified Pseudomonas]QJI34900.1 hypothetical protein HKK54_10905 [Pseudomonas sp. ADAK13]
MSLSLLHSPRALAALALASLLSGCSIHGAYTDASAPDAAKLRFISNTSNTTLDIYDAQHCTGQNTGMLNNFLVVDTKRRADMLVPPPAKARGMLEVKLAPGKETMLAINTNGGSYICGKTFSFTPKAGEEYEVTFDMERGRCSTLFQRLSRFGGKDVRIPQPVFDTGFPVCQGQSPIFAKPLPDTAQRTVLIDRILAENARAITTLDPPKADSPTFSPEKIDELIAKRKALMGTLTLPDDYWAQYRQNLKQFSDEASGRQARALGMYTDVYRLRLRSTDDGMLQQWLQPTDDAVRQRITASDEYMLRYYMNTSKSVALDTINHHMERMAQLDQRFDVCTRFNDCWHW